MKFDKALITDGVAWAIFGMAQQEKLLYTNSDPFSGRMPNPRVRQQALSLILLFEKLVVHDFTTGSGTYRIPDLESEGIVEFVAANNPQLKVRPLRSSWKPSKLDPRSTAPRSLRRSFALIQAYKPLIIDRLLSTRFHSHDNAARVLGVSRRFYYNEFVDFAINYALGNTVALGRNMIEQALPAAVKNELKRELFDFESRGEDKLSDANVIIAVAMVFADELATIQELSAARGLGVATQHYMGASRISSNAEGYFSVDPSSVPRSFGLVRSVLHEEGHFFPKIQNISHALKLRKNPNLRAFREQFREFHIQLARGDRDSLEKVRREVRKAKQALERTAKWTAALRWLTYISLPAGVAESLLGGSPILGTSLAVLSTAGSAMTTRAYRRNEWVLFGG